MHKAKSEESLSKRTKMTKKKRNRIISLSIFAVIFTIAFAAVTTFFWGLRGTFVNANSPNEFYSFSPLKYSYFNDAEDGEFQENGKWKQDNKSLTLNNRGGNSRQVTFSKFDSRIMYGYKAVFINGTEFKRVNLMSYENVLAKIKLQFDINGGEGENFSRTVKFGEKINGIAEPTREGYLFKGWFASKEGYVNRQQPAFESGNRVWQSETVYANWFTGAQYTIIGSEQESLNALEGTLVLAVLQSVEKTGYTFNYEMRIRTGAVYGDWIPITSDTLMPAAEIEVKKVGEGVARQVKLSFDVDGGTFEPNQLLAAYNTSINLPAQIPTKEGHTFVCWEFDGVKLNPGDLISVPKVDSTIIAKWIPLIEIQFDADGGTGAHTEKIYADETKNVTIPPCEFKKENYTFIGWGYKNTILRPGTTYKFTDVAEGIKLTARWVPYGADYTHLAADGTVKTGQYLLSDIVIFGKYPQVIKPSNVTVSAAADADGFYLGNDGEKYAMRLGDSHVNKVFTDGSTIINRKPHYFKIEPLHWKVLKSDGASVILIADTVIDCQKFYNYQEDDKDEIRYVDGKEIYATNWQYSDIRTYLNGTFISRAFNQSQQNRLVEEEIINKGDASIPYEINIIQSQNNTIDKVYLPSFKDLTNPQYGFPSYEVGEYASNRTRFVNDYARCGGGNVHQSAYLGYGWWISRSPMSDKTISTIAPKGTIDAAYDVKDNLCVVPMLKLSL